MLLFNFGRNNHMSIFDICEDEPDFRLTAYGFDGRIFGKFFQIQISRTNQRPVFSYPMLQWWNRLIESKRESYSRRGRGRTMLVNQYAEGEYIPKRPSKSKMAWEWNWPRFWSWKTTIQLFSCDLYITHKGDHSPGFHFCLVIFNLNLLDFGYYNVYHEDWEEEQAAYEAEQAAKVSK